MDKTEKVARAICIAEGHKPDSFGIKMNEAGYSNDFKWQDYEGAAVAAMEALKPNKHPELKGENILHKGGIIEHWCNSPDCAACNNPTKQSETIYYGGKNGNAAMTQPTQNLGERDD